jgi:ADP-ribosylation factor-binding protein GGA
VLNPSDNLKSAEEMESEEREAQSAKLQELIRRGTPHDLQEANKLMKVMAGYDTRKKTDYRAKAAEEVGKIQQKARLLEEMLQGYKSGDEIKEGDVFEELSNALASAHPKIQKMCEEESDDTEAVAKLFEINDSIHRTIERYKLIKKGDIEAANAIPKGTLGTSGAGVRKGPDNELSLIDFDGPEQAAPQQQQEQSAPAPPPKAGNALEDDLLGLNMGDGNFGEGGGISLGSSSNGNSKAPSMGNADIMAQFSQPQQQRSTPQPSMPAMFSQPAPSQSASTDLFGSLSGPSSHSITPSPQQQQQPAQKKADPFAALSNSNSRSGSPFQFQSRAPAPAAPAAAPASSSFDLLGGAAPTASAPVPVADDDEWAFSSALPDKPQDLVVVNSSVKAVFTVSRPNSSELTIASRITNSTTKPITDLTFQLAVTKVSPRFPSIKFLALRKQVQSKNEKKTKLLPQLHQSP